MRTSPGFSDDNLIRAFKIICAEGSITAKKLAEKTGVSNVCIRRIIKYLGERGFLSQKMLYNYRGRGRKPLSYSPSRKVSMLIYDFRNGDIVIHLYSLRTKRSKMLLFKYKNKRSNESKLSFFIRTQKSVISTFAREKLVIGALYVIDGRYDGENDTIISKSFPALSEYTFSQLKGNIPNVTLVDFGELISDYLSDIIKSGRTLLVNFELNKKIAYLYEDGKIALSADIDEIQNIPAMQGFSLNDITHREENIANTLNLLCRMLAPDSVYVASPYIDTAATFQIREKFDSDVKYTRVSGDDILFIDSAAFDFEEASLTYILKRLPPSMLKGN